ncbi:hypothetical protein D3C79_992980 [compost metagenome]
MTFGTQNVFAFVPVEDIQAAHLFGQHPVEQCRVEVGGEINALLALALAAAQVGNHQPRMFHQGIGFAEQRGTAVSQPIFRTAGTPLLADPVRIGQRQQGAQPAGMVRVGNS